MYIPVTYHLVLCMPVISVIHQNCTNAGCDFSILQSICSAIMISYSVYFVFGICIVRIPIHLEIESAVYKCLWYYSFI